MKAPLRSLTLIVLVVISSCDDPLLDSPKKNDLSNSLVAEAEQWFTRSGHRSARSKTASLAWNESVEIVSGKVVAIPELPTNTGKAVFNQGKIVDARNYLVFHKVGQDFVLATSVIIPDESFRGKMNKFSGRVLYMDEDGSFIEGLRFRNGRVTGSLKKPENRSAGRLITECTTVTIDWYTMACSTSNGLTVCDVTYSSTETYTECETYDDGTTPAGGGGGGPGGGGANGSQVGPFYDLTETPEILQFESDYKNQMSDEEKKLYAKLSRREQLIFLNNALQAVMLANSYFASSNRNRNDALRHAFFHGLNTKYLSVSLSRSLGDAHEEYPNNNPLDKEMDLHNNEKGRQIALTLMSQNLNDHFFDEGLAIRILEAMGRGELKMIVNGQVVPTNYGAVPVD